MRFARVNNAHFNINLMQSFYWCGGKLFIYWSGEEGPDTYPDEDRTNYLSLCRAAGVAPITKGGDADG